MYRPCLHCEGKRYDKDYCPQICKYGELIKEEAERIEQLDKIVDIEDKLYEVECPICNCEFNTGSRENCGGCERSIILEGLKLTRPSQSWCYVEEL